jgi:citrate synthase
MPEFEHDQVRSRNEAFAELIPSRIWRETPSASNPYLATAAQCHGYDLMDLMQHCRFVEVFYLLFRGELPSEPQAQLLEQLMIALINPGPRHPATRAAMNAGIGKTEAAHILPIGLGVLGGAARQVEEAMRFMRRALKTPIDEQLQKLSAAVSADSPEDWLTASAFESTPGFGRHYGDCDLLTQKLATQLSQLPAAGEVLAWGESFARALQPLSAGWLPAGLAAAVFCDLGFQPRVGASLFQLLSAPGLAAQGVEMSNKPITAMPFVKDEDYVIER